MLYYLIIALQLACAYHVYKTQNQAYWYFVILLVPVLGSIVYIITQMIQRQQVESVQKELIQTFNPTKKIKDLVQQVAFADTFQNRLLLADGYSEVRAFAKAETEYLSALKGSHANDYYGQCQLIAAYYAQEKYTEAIEIGKKLELLTAFEGSDAQFTYGLERLILAEYFLDQDKTADALDILKEMQLEAGNMTKPNLRLYRETFARVDELVEKHRKN